MSKICSFALVTTLDREGPGHIVLMSSVVTLKSKIGKSKTSRNGIACILDTNIHGLSNRNMCDHDKVECINTDVKLKDENYCKKVV